MAASDAGSEHLRLHLTSIAHGGEAVGRADQQVVFAAYGLPGEEVEVQVTERHRRFLRGRVSRVVQPAVERVAPPCPIFATCGGCQWQHASYAAQLAYKTSILREQLQRLGGFSDPPIAVGIAPDEPWHYRNTVQLTPAIPQGQAAPGLPSKGGLSPQPSVLSTRFVPWPGKDVTDYRRPLCFKQAQSHDLVAIEHCYIADPMINTVLAEAPWEALPDDDWRRLSSVVIRVAPPDAAQVMLVADPPLVEGEPFARALMSRLPAVTGVLEASARAGVEAHLLAGSPELVYDLDGLQLAVPATAFFQVNLPATVALAGLVQEWLAPAGGERVLDAYAGVGTFSLPLARRAAEVVAVEAHAAAATAARQNAQRNALGNVTVRADSVERALPRIRGRLDLAVLDPPRRGCGTRFLEALADRGPRRIAYVSCEPSTLARDLKLLAGHGYRLTRVQPVDLFPQTSHVESVVLLDQD